MKHGTGSGTQRLDAGSKRALVAMITKLLDGSLVSVTMATGFQGTKIIVIEARNP